MDKKIRVYVSHSIRGKLGVNATAESMAVNNKKAHEAAIQMRLIMPELDFYIPGEHDEVISILFHDGRLKDGDILWADCELIKQTCALLIVYAPDNFISAGMQIEMDYAFEQHIPIFLVLSIDDLQDQSERIRKRLRANNMMEKIMNQADRKIAND